MSDQKPLLKSAEGWLESILFSSRWLLAPFYAGLAFSLVVLLIKFLAELIHIAANAFTATESEVILGVLALVDLTLTGSLIIIVIFSGYENFVSRIDHGHHTDWPEWMGKIDFSGLKLKLLSSIVAISGIQLLKQFMSISKVSDRDIMWLVIVHVVFVVSSVLLALSDRLTVHGDGHKKSGGSGGGKGSAPQHGASEHGSTPTAASVAAQASTRTSATGSQQIGAPTAPAQRARVEVTRVEINRTRNVTPQKQDAPEKPEAPAARPATRTVQTEIAEPDDRMPGERPPTIKRRLH